MKYRVAAITGGKNVPSAIYRIRALRLPLAGLGVSMTEFCPVFDKYPPRNKFLRPVWLASALLERISYVFRTRGFDATILQRELISTIPTLEKILPGPKILDVDDAIYLRRNGRAAKNAAEAAIGVVCGNEILADVFSRWNKNIEIVSTGVDVGAMPMIRNRAEGALTVGWIGTPANMRYVDSISGSILMALKTVKGSRLRIVTSDKHAIPSSLRSVAEFVKWMPGIENVEIPSWSVGIMPLVDDEWARGKCAFKMLQYMAAGIPVVVSPVGMNQKIIDSASIGYAPLSGSEWTDAIVELLLNDSLNTKMGVEARLYVEKFYDLSVIAKKWEKVLDGWLG